MLSFQVQRAHEELNSTALSLGLAAETPDNILPRHDSSVYFSSATICRFKEVLLNTECVPERFLTQWCFRSRSFEDLKAGRTPHWNSVFRQFGTLAPYEKLNCHTKAFGAAVKAFAAGQDSQLRALVSSQDIDLLQALEVAKIQYITDSKDPKYYVHRYGDSKLSGRNANFCLRHAEHSDWRDVGNVIVIEKEGKRSAIEVAIGLETLAAAATGLESAISASPFNTMMLRTLCDGSLPIIDLIATIMHLHQAGVRPFSDNRGRVFRKYIELFVDAVSSRAIDWQALLIHGVEVINTLGLQRRPNAHWTLFEAYLNELCSLPKESRDGGANKAFSDRWAARWPPRITTYDSDRV